MLNSLYYSLHCGFEGLMCQTVLKLIERKQEAHRGELKGYIRKEVEERGSIMTSVAMRINYRVDTLGGRLGI